MALTTKPTNEYIKFVRGTKDQYLQLNKRNDTLYFVYDNENSLTGELYLGNKQIGDGTGGVSSLTELISDVVSDGDLLVYDEVTESWIPQPIEDAIRTMIGATAAADGAAGLVPIPQAGDQNKFLRGDGTWVEITSTLAAVDETSIELNSNDEVSIKGFSNAPVGAIPQKTSSGISWVQSSSVNGGLSYKKVNSLNEVNEEATVYFVPNNNSGTDNLFDEYMYIDGSVELIGSTGNVNLNNYVTLSNFNSTVGNLYTSLGAKADQSSLDTLTETVNEINERLVWQEIAIEE